MVAASNDGRRQREAEFHDQWASEIRPDSTLVDETFTAPTAVENRYILEQFGDVRGKRVLDYGCGSGEGGIYFAKQGAVVVGIDVSVGMLNAARALASHHGVAIETRRVQGDRIPADDGEFDFVYGNGVLHHVDLDLARRELARVMKRGGTGCFIEPLTYNPAIEVYRRLADTVRTPDEKPLSFRDIERFKETFDHVSHREFWLTTLCVFLKFYFIDRVDPRRERYWKKIYTDAKALAHFYEPLRRLDDALLARLPVLGRLCWTTVITVRSPRG
jgi:SAM-dependent methyltransferase